MGRRISGIFGLVTNTLNVRNNRQRSMLKYYTEIAKSSIAHDGP